MLSLSLPIFKVVYNDRYGGFDLSNKAIQEYNKRSQKQVTDPDEIERSDQHLIELIESMGNEVNTKNSKLKIMEFPLKFKKFLRWYEYDGKESISIEYDVYISHQIKFIINDHTISNDKKVELIQDVYNEINHIKSLA